MQQRIVDRFARVVTAAFVVMTLVVTGGQLASAEHEDDEHAPANVVPIDVALATVQRDYPGRVLKVELERDDDRPSRWIYEVKVLTRAGHVIEIELDAVSMAELRVEGDRSRRSDDD